MKKMKKKWALLLLFVFLMGMSGCGEENEEYISLNNGIADISFSWWGNDNRHIYTLDAMEIFQQKNPEIRVKSRYSVWNGYEKRNKAYMEAHNEADVMQINYAWLHTFSRDGEGYYDLNELADSLGLDSYTENSLSYGMVNGKLNAVPIALNSYILYINQDLFEKYGLENPVTWEDYFEAAKVMSADGIYPLGVVKKQIWFLLLSYYEQSTGRYVFGENGEFLLDETGMVMILDFYYRLLEEKVLMPVSDFERGKFISEKAASSLAWVSDAGSYCNELGEKGVNVVVGEYPSVADKKLSGQYIKPATMYAISKNTEHPEEAAQLLDFLLNSEDMALLQGIEKGVPVSSMALQVLVDNQMLTGYQYEASQKMMEEHSEMRLIIPAMENNDVIDAFKEGADEFIYHKKELSECAKEICEKIAEITKE